MGLCYMYIRYFWGEEGGGGGLPGTSVSEPRSQSTTAKHEHMMSHCRVRSRLIAHCTIHVYYERRRELQYVCVYAVECKVMCMSPKQTGNVHV